ncbi:glycosyltransferase family 4 protein [Fodinisporobacter ferrooxydans]|uniref:Glycosyltransferase family 4 protein n=1 Tax=Fodinisporobacter ferrooxydans TaxID=2901836 RepID=A0ABY4CER1_9BACL|nr:glycosyltransferase family 4 protein [Alicyclobacillaceae bacterium MYW30-H2]
MKKAAFVASTYRHIQAFHMPYLLLLQRYGYEIHVFAREDEAKRIIRDANVMCHDIPIQRSPFHWENWRAFRELLKRFHAESFDLVHVHTPVAGILGRAAAGLSNVPNVLYTAHGFHFFRGAPLLHWILYYPLEYLMARLTDHLIVINEEDYDLAQRLPVRGQVHYVPGVGLDVASYQLQDGDGARQRLRKELGICKEDFVIVCIAEFTANKNQMQLIHAVRLLKTRGKHVKCLLVGQGETQRQVREQAKRQGLESDVFFLGTRLDIAEILAAADVCALVSLREGLPRSLMEAMACGKPIVATRIRGNRNLVVHEETGFLVTPGNAQETADAMVRLHASPELCATMGRKSKILSKSLDLSVILAKMERIYLS